MVTRLLNLAGLYLGPEKDLLVPASDNRDGFWENIQFMELNELLLAHQRGAWDLPPVPVAGWETSEAAQPFRTAAQQLIASFAGHEPWGWKDPRSSLTLPFWKNLIPDLKVIICLRNPMEVARSLTTRGSTSLAFGLNLWQIYYERLWAEIPETERVITHYEVYMRDAKAELQRLLAQLNMATPTEVVAAACSAVVPQLRHHAIATDTLLADGVPARTVRLYEDLCAGAGPIYTATANQPDPGPAADSNLVYLRSNIAESYRLQMLEGEFQSMQRELQKRAETITSLANSATELKSALDAANELLAQQKIQIANQQQNITNQEWRILEQSKTIAEQNAIIAERNKSISELNQAGEGLKSHLTEQIQKVEAVNRTLVERDKAIAWLQDELTIAREDVRAMSGSKFWKIRNVFHGLKNQVQRRVANARYAVGTAARRARKALRPRGVDRLDFYQTLQIRPEIPADQQSQILAAPPSSQSARRIDILCFAIIDWSFRFQRPQHIMAQFAAQGHRVFYVRPTGFLPSDSKPAFTARQIRPNIYEVSLAAPGPLDIYKEIIDGDNLSALNVALADLRQAFEIDEALSYVMKVSWAHVALAARERWGWKVLYDCMDEWDGFPGIRPALIDLEPELVRQCDLLVVTGQRLQAKWQPLQPHSALVRNAVDYDFYQARLQPNELLKGLSAPIVGYFGAIADWFDVDLVARVATQRPGYTFVLLGNVFNVDVSPLQALPNVRLLGQQPYDTMPQYLYHFDVCLIPFKVNAITAATDPVKLYEYFAGGRPVVSTDLPEIAQYADCVYLAHTPETFLAQLDAAVGEADPERVERRKEIARQNTWQKRYRQITAAWQETGPRTSLVLVTYNNLSLTKLCLESIVRNTDQLNYEIIIVDNNSTDGTPAYLRHLAGQLPQLTVIYNKHNEGFAKANNQGLAQATGDYLVLLNNDTIVPPNWLQHLLRHLADPGIGLVGPVTNFVGNEAYLDVSYQTWYEMETFAASRAKTYAGQVADIDVLAMFCVAFRRDVFQAIGNLDEQFGIGMFEDDDYALRVKEHGYRVVCALDTFVHHFGQAAFKKLIQDGRYNHLFAENQRRFESKWQRLWTPHRHAPLTPTSSKRPAQPSGSASLSAKH
jgi:GT2 family glycosyltransferase/glycosyltransferase involved in cell wall biosynthesis